MGAVALLVGIVNASSRMIEADQHGVHLDWREPWVWELSSNIALIALAPAIGWVIARWPYPPKSWPRFIAAHVAAATLFAAAHVALMVALRKLAYALAGSVYEFSHGQLALNFFYEWRKDLLSYVAVAFCFWWFADQRARRAALPAASDRLEIKDGARAIFLEPAEIFWIEAAGNYVELHAAAATHLARGTLAAFEARLAPRGFVRVHRSRLVNRARIRAAKPTPSGDLELTLDDGRTILASRRYRANLAAAPTI